MAGNSGDAQRRAGDSEMRGDGGAVFVYIYYLGPALSRLDPAGHLGNHQVIIQVLKWLQNSV